MLSADFFTEPKGFLLLQSGSFFGTLSTKTNAIYIYSFIYIIILLIFELQSFQSHKTTFFLF